jgi:hypothetical protein
MPASTAPFNEPEVRRRIEQALCGQVLLPDGIPARWQVRVNFSAAETELAERLIRS